MKRIVVVVALLLVVGCPAPTAPPPTATPAAPATWPSTVRLRGEAFASDWAVTIVVDNARDQLHAQSFVATVDAALAEVTRQLSAWDRDSEVARFSAARHLRPLQVSAAAAVVVDIALDVAKNTDGAFEPTIGPLLDLWGFSPATRGKVTSPPSAAAIAVAKHRIGYHRIHVDSGALRKDDDDVTLDVTALADSAGAAAIAAILRERGFTNFLVDIAGEVVVSGHGEKRPWRVGINTPSSDADPGDSVRQAVLVPASSSLLALSTSGTYRNAWDKDGQRYSHIIDPGTGAPVVHDLVSCTIVGADVVVADAMSTACIVLGEDKTRAVLSAHYVGYDALFIRAPTSTSFATTTTAGFPPAP